MKTLHLLYEGTSWIYAVKVVTDALLKQILPQDYAFWLWIQGLSFTGCRNHWGATMHELLCFAVQQKFWTQEQVYVRQVWKQQLAAVALAWHQACTGSISQLVEQLKLHRTAPAVPVAWTISPLACQVCSNSMRHQCCPSLSTDPRKTVCKSCFQILSPSVQIVLWNWCTNASILSPFFGEASPHGRGLYEQNPTGVLDEKAWKVNLVDKNTCNRFTTWRIWQTRRMERTVLWIQESEEGGVRVRCKEFPSRWIPTSQFLVSDFSWEIFGFWFRNFSLELFFWKFIRSSTIFVEEQHRILLRWDSARLIKSKCREWRHTQKKHIFWMKKDKFHTYVWYMLHTYCILFKYIFYICMPTPR